MSPSFYQIRQCENPACGLRYPLTEGHPFGERCPLCLGSTRMELQRPLNPDIGFSPSPPTHLPEGEGHKLEALLDNVRSAWNVGAIFRTADALGVRRLHLCGITPTPENAAVAKTALGADSSVPWTASKNALTAAEKLKAEGYQLWALEQDERATSIYDLAIDDLRHRARRVLAARSIPDSQSTNPQSTNLLTPIVLIVGNEITGVDPALLDLCNRIVYIPMRGQKRSLNVEVAFGVAVSQILNSFQ